MLYLMLLHIPAPEAPQMAVRHTDDSLAHEIRGNSGVKLKLLALCHKN